MASLNGEGGFWGKAGLKFRAQLPCGNLNVAGLDAGELSAYIGGQCPHFWVIRQMKNYGQNLGGSVGRAYYFRVEALGEPFLRGHPS